MGAMKQGRGTCSTFKVINLTSHAHITFIGKNGQSTGLFALVCLVHAPTMVCLVRARTIYSTMQSYMHGRAS